MPSSFSVDADDVEIILDPKEFYNTLLNESKRAKNRILISTLYLGNGELEQELISTWAERLYTRGSSFRLKALFDANRGTRSGSPSSASLMQPLLKKGHVRVSLFHSPWLRGLAQRLVPQRWNELPGTQHMKIYAFDDTVILSGANLSHDYFTCRVDRYLVFRNVADLVDFYEGLLDVMAECSLTLKESGDVVFEAQDASGVHPFKGNYDDFCRYCGNLVRGFLKNYAKRKEHAITDTTVTPVFQMQPFGICDDEEATIDFINRCQSGSRLDIATSYFNLASSYATALESLSRSSVNIVAAGPESHGFHGASGMSSYVPIIYVETSKRFLAWLESERRRDHISFAEYSRPGWVFHAKGLWYTPANVKVPSVTFVGSSNFGYRSVKRDLENQLIVSTENFGLRQRLAAERDEIFSRAQRQTLADVAGRHVSFIVRFFLPIVRRFV